MKLIFSANIIDNSTAISHPQKVNYTPPKNNTRTLKSSQQQIINKGFSFGMFERLSNSKDCNCGK